MGHKVEIILNAVIVIIIDNNPAILRLSGSSDIAADALPSGKFLPDKHNSLDDSFLNLATTQTGMELENCTQLYAISNNHDSSKSISINYLAQTTIEKSNRGDLSNFGAQWKNIYSFVPWEDWRNGRPEILDETILPAVREWNNSEGAYQASGADQIFGIGNFNWNPALAAKRFELMLEAGLLEESVSEGYCKTRRINVPLGNAMKNGNRITLATALDHMRNPLKYMPVLPGLMNEDFTLTQLQQCTENISGQILHKQNFRRQIDNMKLVIPTGQTQKVTGGRPAAMYRFS